MGKIMISTDSPADFSKDCAEKYNIRVSPLHVNLGSESFSDGVDITPDDIFKKYNETKELPKTSSVSIAEYTDFFTSIINEGYDEIVHISLSSKISSTYQNAVIASDEIENGKVYVIDSMTLSASMMLLVLKACEFRDMGFSAKEIYDRTLALRERNVGGFIIDKLEFLHKGGRCSGIEAFGANLLGIKPCIDLVDGGMVTGKKYRGKTDVCQIKYVCDKLCQYGDKIDTDRIILHTTSGFSEAQKENIKKEIKKHIKFKEILTPTAGCVISSHCGANTLGLFFMLKP